MLLSFAAILSRMLRVGADAGPKCGRGGLARSGWSKLVTCFVSEEELPVVFWAREIAVCASAEMDTNGDTSEP